MPTELEGLVRKCAEQAIEASLVKIDKIAVAYDNRIKKLKGRLAQIRPPQSGVGAPLSRAEQSWIKLDAALTMTQKHLNYVTGILRSELRTLVDRTVAASDRIRVPPNLITSAKVCPQVNRQIAPGLTAVHLHERLDAARREADEQLKTIENLTR